ncbi:hypothetical protein C8Q75DRAFT_745737 [Abortiporus biennis]|nr:hypothetical protein C8Q75DRAFT_745737 [Abortiporus biennis]
MSNHLRYPEPPTQASIGEARRELASQRESVQTITSKIATAEQELARFIEESRHAIRQMHQEREELQEKVTMTLAYISPIRRLPNEILRQIFLCNFEEYPCCAWVLSSVCSLWRRLVLHMPKLWSKIRLITSQDAPADTIRLWLERSGQTCPLDIQIFLHIPGPPQENVLRRRPRRSSTGTIIIGDGWGLDGAFITHIPIGLPGGPALVVGNGNFTTTAPGDLAAVQPNGTHQNLVTGYDGLPPFGNGDQSSSSSSSSQPTRSRASLHWGYVAFYYLAEQMHRWERFIFRFNRHFSSIGALSNIVGDTPLLREFEVTCSEFSYSFPTEWSWFPCAKPANASNTERLQSLTLQHVPFKWSAPIFKDLRNLVLRSVPISHLALDRILFIVSSSPNLETLSLFFSPASQAVLPLTPTTLTELKSFSIGGNYLLANLVDALTLPALESLSFDIDARDPVDECIASLISRSNSPPLKHLSIAYSNNGTATYYGHGSIESWQFLSDVDTLKTLQVGCMPFEPLLLSLGNPDIHHHVGGGTMWLCPNLENLALRACHTHNDGVAKLVRMVETRNPDSGLMMMGVAHPLQKLKRLDIHDCATLGVDVIAWLKTRIEEVNISEPTFDRRHALPFV